MLVLVTASLGAHTARCARTTAWLHSVWLPPQLRHAHRTTRADQLESPQKALLDEHQSATREIYGDGAGNQVPPCSSTPHDHE